MIVNETKVQMPKFASVNGALQSNYYEIQDNDAIEMLSYYTVRQLTEFMDVILDPRMNIYVNNKLADLDTPVYENFSVVWTLSKIEMFTPQSYEEEWEEDGEYEDWNTPADEEPEKEIKSVSHEITVLVNKVSVTLQGKEEYIFVDVFDIIDFDLSRPRGKGIVTNLNGRPAQYMEPLHEGDVIEIYWQE